MRDSDYFFDSGLNREDWQAQFLGPDRARLEAGCVGRLHRDGRWTRLCGTHLTHRLRYVVRIWRGGHLAL
jgi:hypothetical protein